MTKDIPQIAEAARRIVRIPRTGVVPVSAAEQDVKDWLRQLNQQLSLGQVFSVSGRALQEASLGILDVAFSRVLRLVGPVDTRGVDAALEALPEVLAKELSPLPIPAVRAQHHRRVQRHVRPITQDLHELENQRLMVDTEGLFGQFIGACQDLQKLVAVASEPRPARVRALAEEGALVDLLFAIVKFEAYAERNHRDIEWMKPFLAAVHQELENAHGITTRVYSAETARHFQCSVATDATGPAPRTITPALIWRGRTLRRGEAVLPMNSQDQSTPH